MQRPTAMNAMPSAVLTCEMQMRAAPDASQWLERSKRERRGERLLQAAAKPKWWSVRRPHPDASAVRHRSLAAGLRQREEDTPPTKKINRCPAPGKRSEIWGAAPSTARFARAPFIKKLQDELHTDPTCGGLFGSSPRKSSRAHCSRSARIVSPLLSAKHEQEPAVSMSKDVAISNVKVLFSGPK